jgi:hypothetical protein
MQRVTLVKTTILGTTLFLGMGLYGGVAYAQPIGCTSTITLAGGNGFVNDSSLTAGVCVQTADAIFGAFNIADLPAGGRVAFNTTNVGSPAVGNHGIAFNENFNPGTTYTMDYSVEIGLGTNTFVSLNGDFTQNSGTSTLIKTTTPTGTGSIDWTKVASVGSGPDLVTYSPGATELAIVDTLTDNGSITSVSNDLIENKAVTVSEPATIALLGTGLLSLMLVGRRWRAIDRLAVPAKA